MGHPVVFVNGALRQMRKHSLAYSLILPAVLALATVVGYPLFRVFWMGFFDIEPLKHPEPVFVGLGNYARLLHAPDFWESFFRTAYWTLGSVFLQFVIGLTAALILNENLRGRGLARTLLLIPWVMPAVIGAFAWRWIYHGQYGILNHWLRTLHLLTSNVNWLGNLSTAMTAVVIANTWRGFPFMMVMLLAGLQNIPQELYEAAAVDGASAWQGLRHITLPLLKPVILVVTLLAGIWTFNNFSYIYILTGGGPAGKTDILVTYVYKQGFDYFHFGYAAASSVVLFLIVFAFSLIYARVMRA